MKKSGPTHAERREAARPEAWKPQPRIKPVKDEPKPIRTMGRQTFSKAEIERLKAREAAKNTAARRTPAPQALTLNLEMGMPSVEAALRRLETELPGAQNRGVRQVTLIHGYGSTGNGGLIRPAVRERLEKMSCVESFERGELLPGANPGITCVRLRKK